MKKEYLILIAIILLLSAYLLFYNKETDHTVLPQISKIEAQNITGLDIERKSGVISLVKKDGNWFIKDINRKADTRSVENMLDSLAKLKVSALVSTNKDLNRYELDDAKKIHVSVIQGQKTIFEFSMGKTAPSYNHTFVMLANDDNIYHANGSFRTYFEKSTADLRDKKVMEFKEKSLKSFTINRKGKTATFISEQKENDDKEKEPVITWSQKSSKSIDKEAVTSLVSALSFVECEQYLEPKEKKQLEESKPDCVISLENDQKIQLKLYARPDDDEKTSGISSMSEDAFVLSKFTSKEILANINTLLDIKEKEPEQ